MRRAGVHDPERALRLVADIEAVVGATIDDVPKALSYLADPDGGLLNLLRLVESARDKGVLDALVSLAERRLLGTGWGCSLARRALSATSW